MQQCDSLHRENQERTINYKNNYTDCYYPRFLHQIMFLHIVRVCTYFSTNSQSWYDLCDPVTPSHSINGKMTEFHTSPLTGRESRMSRGTALGEEQG